MSNSVPKQRVNPAFDRPLYYCGDLELNVDERVIRIDGGEEMPTRGEFELLRRLLERPGEVISREHLKLHPTASLRSVDIIVGRLRRKTARAHAFGIEPVVGVGYRCRDTS